MLQEIVAAVVMTALMIGVNALYVAGEFGAVSARKSRIAQMAQEGNRLAKLLLPILEDHHKLDSYIAASQVGITLSSVVLGIYAQRNIAPLIAPLVARIPGVTTEAAALSISATGLLLFFTALQVVLGELVPKSLALRFPEAVATGTVVPMRWSNDIILKPFIILLNGSGAFILRLLGISQTVGHSHIHSPEEIQLLIGQSYEGGLLDAEDRRLLDNAFRLGELTAAEVAVPRTRLVAAPVDSNVRDLLLLAAESDYTRIPLYEGDIDHLVGFVHLKELFRLYVQNPDASVQSILRPLPHVPETMLVTEVWDTLDRENSYLAAVFDEYGGTVGLITREDLIEELIGEVQDEFDTETTSIVRLSDRQYLVRGDLLIEQVNSQLGIQLPEEHAHTIGGLVLHLVGGLPRIGDEIKVDTVRLRVQKAEGPSIVEVVIILPPGQQQTPQVETP